MATHGAVTGQFVFQVPIRSGEAVDAGVEGQHGVVGSKFKTAVLNCDDDVIKGHGPAVLSASPVVQTLYVAQGHLQLQHVQDVLLLLMRVLKLKRTRPGPSCKGQKRYL